MKLVLILTVVISILAVACGSTDAGPTPTQARPTATPLGSVLQEADDFAQTPDFGLPSATGEIIQLSDYRGKQPLVVVFYRGFF